MPSHQQNAYRNQYVQLCNYCDRILCSVRVSFNTHRSIENNSFRSKFLALRCALFRKMRMQIFNRSFFLFLDGEYLFADPDSKLSKYGPKSWRSSHTHVSYL